MCDDDSYRKIYSSFTASNKSQMIDIRERTRAPPVFDLKERRKTCWGLLLLDNATIPELNIQSMADALPYDGARYRRCCRQRSNRLPEN